MDTRRNTLLATITLLLWTVQRADAQTPVWAHAIGGTSADRAFAVAVDGSGAVITVGTFSLTMDLDPGPGTVNVTAVNDLDVFIRKVDASGQFQWGGSFGSVSFDEARSVAVDAANNVVVTGMFRGTVDVDLSPGVSNLVTGVSTDAFVVKYSPTGVLLWAKQLGGSVSDEGRAVAVDASGNVIVTGFFGGTADLDPGTGTLSVPTMGFQDVFVVKLDANGELLWGQGLGGNLSDVGEGIAAGLDGSVFVTGHFRNTVDFDHGLGTQTLVSAGDFDAFVLKLSATGVFQWVDRFGGTSFERGNAIAVDQTGACAVAILFEGALDADPGPGILTLTPAGGDGALIKLNGLGELVWAIQLSSGSATNCNAVRCDGANNLYVAGGFNAPMDIDPGPGSTVLAGGPSQDIFAASYTATGSLRWGFNLGSGNVDAGRAIAVDGSDAVLLAGEFATSLDTDPGTDVLTITGPGQHGFTVKYEQPGCDGVPVSVKAFLEGPYNGAEQLMIDSLRTRGFLPLTAPYATMGFTLTGPSSMSASVLAVSGPDAIVDWVLLELRDATDPSVVMEARALLLQRDGDVVDVDGMSAPVFCRAETSLHVALRHRNHLGVMTALSQPFTGAPLVLDLTQGGQPLFGSDAAHDLNGVQVLWQGNSVFDTLVKYTGASNDRDPILVRIGGIVPTATLAGYWPEDISLDGTVKYTGSGNDRDRVLQTIGGTTPNNTRAQQLP